MREYINYYKRFKKTYHVLLQLESINKNKSIPRVDAPVQAMFMAELNSFLLTAGHDLNRIQSPIKIPLMKMMFTPCLKVIQQPVD